MSYLFAFSYCSWGSQGKNTEVVCHFLLRWTTFCQTSPPWPVHLGWPHTAWLSFTELDKAVVCVIRLASCLWLWFQSVRFLMPSLSAYHLTCISLSLDVGHLFRDAPATFRHCSWPWTWGSSSQLLLHHAATIFRGEITPERTKGWSQSKNNTQLWMELVIEARSDAVKSNIA